MGRPHIKRWSVGDGQHPDDESDSFPPTHGYVGPGAHKGFYVEAGLRARPTCSE